MTTSADEQLQAIFKADRVLHEAIQTFALGGEASARVDAMGKAIEAALQHDDTDESELRLIRLAELLGDETGPQVVKLLLKVFNHEEPSVRAAAGESLLELGYARYAELARGIEKLIEDGKATTALSEVPYLLAEIGEPGGVKLCVRLLKHADGDVVGAAVEALAMLGDPVAIRDLEKLKNDKRAVHSEEELEAGEVTVGELVKEALEHLRGGARSRVES
ncbi:MAG: HEAT repeat domain-containing protein [Myxococcales bacterium]|nr:HEAT repeat domain-containing protein [Myxococcales bacterium]